MDQPAENRWFCLPNLARAHIQRIRKAKSSAREKKKNQNHAGSTMELDEEDDRISQLPQHILQNHILSLLNQQDAVRTCLLSKSWRHLGSTLPKFEFHKSSFPILSMEKFISVVENTLQRYVDQKLTMQEFVLDFSWWPAESKSITDLLNKWIPLIIIMITGLKTFNLTANTFSLPSVVFEAEFLEELFLVGCKLNKIFNSTDEVRVLNRLRKLSLMSVYIKEQTFEKIMSICPLIEHLVLDSCRGIDGSAPLETIFIKNCENNYFSPRLKSLHLCQMHLPTEWLNNLSSNNCPCLEELELRCCSGFIEFNLSSRSIKRLIIGTCQQIFKATLDVPNLLCFEFAGLFLPTSISFATTWNEWKSNIIVWRSFDDADFLSTWSLELYEFLKALSQSQITMDTTYLPLSNRDSTYGGGISEPPVVVEHLCIRANYSSSEVPTLLNLLFRICRPMYIGLPFYAISPKTQGAESIWKTLENKGETRQCDFWQQDLEESSIQVSDENTNEWRPGEACEFSNNKKIRFRLKWRDLS